MAAEALQHAMTSVQQVRRLQQVYACTQYAFVMLSSCAQEHMCFYAFTKDPLSPYAP